MAFAIMIISGFAGLVGSLVALIGFDASWSQALMIYLVGSVLPAALTMAVIYLQTLIRAWPIRLTRLPRYSAPADLRQRTIRQRTIRQRKTRRPPGGYTAFSTHATIDAAGMAPDCRAISRPPLKPAIVGMPRMP